MDDRVRKKQRIWTPLFIMLVCLTVCVSAVVQCVNAGTPLYIQKIGAESVYGGVLVAVFATAAIAARMVSGALVDTFTRRTMILIGAAVILVGSLLPLAHPAIAIQLASRIFQGVGFAIAHTAISSAAADTLPKDRLGEGIGYVSLGKAASTAIGPSLALWLTGMEYPDALSVGVAGIAVIVIGFGCFVRYEKSPEKLPETAGYRLAWEQKERAVEITHETEKAGEAERTYETEKEYRGEIRQSDDGAMLNKGEAAFIDHRGLSKLFEKAALCGALPMFFVAAGLSVFYSFTTVFAKEAGYADPSWFFLIAAITSIVVRAVLSRVLDARDMRKAFAVPVVIGALTLFGIFFIANEVIFYVLGIGYGISLGIMVPLLNSVAVKAAPPGRYGPASALFFLLYDAGVGVGAFVWGWLIGFVGYGAVFVGGALCFCAAFAIALRLFPRAAHLPTQTAL